MQRLRIIRLPLLLESSPTGKVDSLILRGPFFGGGLTLLSSGVTYLRSTIGSQVHALRIMLHDQVLVVSSAILQIFNIP